MAWWLRVHNSELDRGSDVSYLPSWLWNPSKLLSLCPNLSICSPGLIIPIWRINVGDAHSLVYRWSPETWKASKQNEALLENENCSWWKSNSYWSWCHFSLWNENITTPDTCCWLKKKKKTLTPSPFLFHPPSESKCFFFIVEEQNFMLIPQSYGVSQWDRLFYSESLVS